MKWTDIVRVGTVAEVDPEIRALVRVQVLDRLSDWMPVLMFANSFKRRWEPMRVGEQVMIFSPDGDPDGGFVVRGIFHTPECKEPDGAGESVEVTEYEDGTVITYDTEAKVLSVTLAGDASVQIGGAANITVTGDAVIEAANATVRAEAVTVDAASVDLGVGGAGVVTRECLCAFTGNPHPDASSAVKAIKG